MKKLSRSLMIVCGAAALAMMPACYSTGSHSGCSKCGSAHCDGHCDGAAKACGKCGKVGCPGC